jgi:hypothetical protein
MQSKAEDHATPVVDLSGKLETLMRGRRCEVGLLYEDGVLGVAQERLKLPPDETHLARLTRAPLEQVEGFLQAPLLEGDVAEQPQGLCLTRHAVVEAQALAAESARSFRVARAPRFDREAEEHVRDRRLVLELAEEGQRLRERSRLERQARLAGAARAGHCQQTGRRRGEERAHLGELPLAAEKGRRRHRQVRPVQAPKRRELAVAELVEPFGRAQVLESVVAESRTQPGPTSVAVEAEITTWPPCAAAAIRAAR